MGEQILFEAGGGKAFAVVVDFNQGALAVLDQFVEMRRGWPVMIAFEHEAGRKGGVVLDHDPTAKVKRADGTKADVAVAGNVITADLIEQLLKAVCLPRLNPSNDRECALLGVNAVRGRYMIHAICATGQNGCGHEPLSRPLLKLFA